METKSYIFFFSFILLISCFLASNQRQTLVLHDLYETRFFNEEHNSAIERSLFEVKGGESEGSDYYKSKIVPQEGCRERDRIEMLPGQPPVGFTQYGGYVTIDEKLGRAFYYYFVEAERAKRSRPLLLWLNGGPAVNKRGIACSSLAYGAMEEVGPFRVHSDGKTLYRNPYSWNHAANVLFLESPAGVGFSYSNTTSDLEISGDRKTAENNYVFLMNWLERFPEYKDREFYISGENYAGHYVPQLANLILQGNKKAYETLVNLKGIIIGNAAINWETDVRGYYDFFGNRALISPEISSGIKRYCNFSLNASFSEECHATIRNANTGEINIYNIYYPLCHNNNLTAKPKKASVLKFDYCNENYVHAYMNNPQVQLALHANVTKLSYEWKECSGVIRRWEDSALTVLPLLKDFIENGLRVWVYSGDAGAILPVTSTQYSLEKLNLSVNTIWHPWYLNEEVGGYTQIYKGGFTFATVRGAGHRVPSDKPIRALSLIKHFLRGIALPNKSTTPN